MFTLATGLSRLLFCLPLPELFHGLSPPLMWSSVLMSLCHRALLWSPRLEGSQLSTQPTTLMPSQQSPSEITLVIHLSISPSSKCLLSSLLFPPLIGWMTEFYQCQNGIYRRTWLVQSSTAHQRQSSSCNPHLLPSTQNLLHHPLGQQKRNLTRNA